MFELNDLLLLLQTGQPIICIETHEEQRALELVKRCQTKLGKRVLQWTITSGLTDASTGRPPLSLADKSVSANIQDHQDPKQALMRVKTTSTPSVVALLDFHGFLDEPFTVRMIKEIAQDFRNHGHHLIFISPALKLPDELSRLSAQFTLSLPDRLAIRKLIVEELKVWKFRNPEQQLRADRKSIHLLVNNLLGLSVSDCQRLIRNAVYDDNAISKSDISKIQRAKYELIGQEGVLSFEFETAKFGEVGGFANLKSWLELRKSAFLPAEKKVKLDVPKGILLVGIQGCGKSLAARAVAGTWNVPLLRLDFGALYNKFFGETEKNMRQAITLAETMSPCVLWIDEIEKGISTGDYDSGTSQRLLATLLTWMADNAKPVFIVATANNISALPPELIRKGRLDEVFFVDLPNSETREQIFLIHLKKREVAVDVLPLAEVAAQSEGFSGAEIEQVVVSALYQSAALDQVINEALLLAEIKKTSPLSRVMSEKISQLQSWAQNRTVPAN